MHASASIRNVSRSLMVYLRDQDLGADLVPADDVTFDTSAATRFVRVRCDQMTSRGAHRLSGDPAELAELTVIAECYARTGEANAVVTVDSADAIAESVMDALRNADVTVSDYTSRVPTSVNAAHTLRFTRPPSLTTLPPADGWARRIVTAPGRWVLRHQ